MYFLTFQQHFRCVQLREDEPDGCTRDGGRKYSAQLWYAPVFLMSFPRPLFCVPLRVCVTKVCGYLKNETLQMFRVTVKGGFWKNILKAVHIWPKTDSLRRAVNKLEKHVLPANMTRSACIYFIDCILSLRVALWRKICHAFFSLFSEIWKEIKELRKHLTDELLHDCFFSPGLVSDAEKESPLISLKRSNATPIKPHEGNGLSSSTFYMVNACRHYWIIFLFNVWE